MFHYIWWQFSMFEFWAISWQSPFNWKLPFPPFWVTSSMYNSLRTQSTRILLARMNDKKSRLSEKIGRYLQPWIPTGLLVLSARLMKHETLARRGWETKRIQRTKKGEKNGLKPTNEKEKIVHEYCRRKHNKIAHEKIIKHKTWYEGDGQQAWQTCYSFFFLDKLK